MAENNKPKNDENITDAPTIIGKEAEEIITAAAEATDAPDDSGDTRKIEIPVRIEETSDLSGDTQVIDLAGKISEADKTEEESTLDEEDDFPPVTFSKEDVIDESEEQEELEEDIEESEKGDVKPEKIKKHSDFSAFWDKVKKPVLITAGVIVGAAVITYAACIATLPTDTVSKNVYIESLNVGGLTYDEALASVTSTYLFENQKVTLKSNNQTFEIDGLDIGLSASPEETTQKAFGYAKSGNKFLDGLQAMGLLFHRHTVVPVAEINQEKLDDKLWQFGVQIHGELVGHYVEVRDNNESTVWPGHTGFNNDVSLARDEILAAFNDERFTNIPVTLESAPPPDITVEQYDLAVYKDPTDAQYEVSGGEVSIIPEVNGRYIDKEKVAPILATVKEGVDPVTVPWETAYAELTEAVLQERLYNDVLASYSTYYGNSTANRSANVARAAALLNGAVLGPGDIFSFNDKVGQRTTYNGFYTAPEYVNGETVQGIGGGTCQVSTTLYSAVLYAGLDIVSRTNHMFSVSYAPLGQDATVADSGVDFQFQNNTAYPVKVKSYTDGASIYVDIVGTAWEPAREVKLDHSVSYGSGGTYVYSKRYIYENGECIIDEELPSSYYKAH